MKTTLLWCLALFATAALSFYGGHYRASSSAHKAEAAAGVTLTKMHLDLLSAGRADEDLALQTKLMDFYVASFHKRLPLYSPLDAFSDARLFDRRSVMMGARDTRYNHPELTFRPETLAQIAAFERRYPYSSSATRR